MTPKPSPTEMKPDRSASREPRRSMINAETGAMITMNAAVGRMAMPASHVE